MRSLLPSLWRTSGCTCQRWRRLCGSKSRRCTAPGPGVWCRWLRNAQVSVLHCQAGSAQTAHAPSTQFPPPPDKETSLAGSRHTPVAAVSRCIRFTISWRLSARALVRLFELDLVCGLVVHVHATRHAKNMPLGHCLLFHGIHMLQICHNVGCMCS
jgi:hypothetical protein